MTHATRSVFADLFDTLLPARCPGCGQRGAPICDRCARTLKPAPHAPPPEPIAWWTACFAYDGVARELVARAKYRNERRFLVLVAGELARACAATPFAIDLITWAPASARRIRAQGVDHGELLARAVARLIGVRAAPGLLREPGPPQTGLDARARHSGPRLTALRRFDAMSILVIDDVATTGGTLAAAARVLQQAGAVTVSAATIARTPAPGGDRPGAAYTPNTPVGIREPTR